MKVKIANYSAVLFLIFDIKSEIKLFVGYVKEITHMDLNKLSYWEDIWKLRFDIEKFNVLYIR